jgi:hypothetical protein
MAEQSWRGLAKSLRFIEHQFQRLATSTASLPGDCRRAPVAAAAAYRALERRVRTERRRAELLAERRA